MYSGKEFQILGPSDLRLFVPYVFVFVLVTAMWNVNKKGPACTLDLKHLVF